MTDNKKIDQTLETFAVDSLSVRVYPDGTTLAQDAAQMALECLGKAIEQQGSAAAILATGNSQLQFLDAIASSNNLDWSKVTFFHLDEYVGIAAEHPASFRRYLRDRAERPLNPKTFHYLQGDAPNPLAECERYTQLLQEQPIDLCCLGVGANGHLAFNEPDVADFDDPQRVKPIELASATRQQQVDSGCFPTLDSVPQFALTLTLPAICTAKNLFCFAPGIHKAAIARKMLKSPISPQCPASILRSHPQATLFLDRDAVSQL
ncbi:glucosamine-6-phosphate deaminase [Lusitaniella coriacea]|uniref:glucosamine-6-phosphate deaminase n=1 Tax=Lusitaniella coriacea TaxID=1983105 RepID=UPI001D159BDE|nr:glucosamine-6-phosphate deaminase [Lusitaniella coriacea]